MISAWLFVGALIGGFALTATVCPLVAWLAGRLKVVDRPDTRKTHGASTPSLGGLAIFLGLVIGALSVGVLGSWEWYWGIFSNPSHVALLVSCGAVFAVGLLDDVRGLGPLPKIVVPILAATLPMQAGYLIDTVVNPLGESIDLGLFAFPVTLLWYVGVTHSFNLIDGLDGLLGGVGAVALLGCAALGILGNYSGTAVFALALAGALIGFTLWNWFPARIFAGDSGSLLVGFATAALALKVSRNVSGAVSLHVPLLLCALPAAETFITLMRRYVNGQPFFSPDRGHVHHMLLRKGLRPPSAALVLCAVQVLFVGCAIAITVMTGPITLIPLAVVLVVAAASLRWLGYPELRVLWDRFVKRLRHERRHEYTQFLALVQAAEKIENVQSFAELKQTLGETAQLGGFDRLALEWGPAAPGEAADAEGPDPSRPGENDTREGRLAWQFLPHRPERSESAADRGCTRYTYPLVTDGIDYGRLVCERSHDPVTPLPNERDILIHLATPIRNAIARLSANAERPDAGETLREVEPEVKGKAVEPEVS